MKQMGLLVLFSWALLSLSAQPVFANATYGVFMVSKGAVKIQTAAQKISDAKVGSKVFEGDSVITGPDSRAKIVMSDRNVINISPDTELKISVYRNDGKPGGDKNVELNLLKGKVRNNVEQKYDDEKNKFQVKTVTAVAGVRGTQFVVSFDPGTRLTSVATLKGQVRLTSLNLQGQAVGIPVTVNKGETTSAAPDKAPEAPKAMPKEEAKKVDADTTAAKESPAQSREVASEKVPGPTSGPKETMIDKKDMDTKIATEIKDVRAPVAPPPPPRIPATAPTNDIVKDIVRDSAGKTKVIVRPTK